MGYYHGQLGQDGQGVQRQGISLRMNKHLKLKLGEASGPEGEHV